ncbi:MAG TPA: SDR family oxidoreductase [Candidatus Limnocylindrales bacterium]|jgi:3-oxoacyl-[acyl-carrier protein] reductase|nr:SDR family oxidoreductase [Candidatus Limnocylindrales bacterium]
MKHHIISGAASGIGYELARVLLARGDAVMACDLKLEPMAQLSSATTAAENLQIRKLDVRDPARWEAIMQEAGSLWPRIDTVMNVAGVMRVGSIEEITPEDVDFHFDINCKGVIHGTQAAFRAMRNQADQNGRGHIINIASLAGISPIPGASLYSASKFAVRGYSLSVMPELKKFGIALTVVCPDAVATPMTAPFHHKPEAALIFSGSRLLQIPEVVRAIVDHGLEKRPVELTMPKSRAILTKLAGALPGLATKLFMESLTKQGRKKQAALP